MRLTVLALPFLLGSGLASQTGTPTMVAGDQWLAKPVDDRTFNTYLEFFTYDRQLPLDLKVTKVEDDQGIRRERLSFQSTPGVRVTGVLFQGPAAGGTKPPGLILLHGGGPQGKDGAFMVQLGGLLSRAGWSVMTLDLPYFGERSTQLLTTFSDKEKHDNLYNQSSVYLAWVTQTVKDIRRGIDLLVEQRGVDPRRTGIVGSSRGAIVATIAAGVERRLSPVLLLFAGHVDALETNHLGAACPANYIARIAPRPVLMINGTQDSDMIRERAVEPLFRLAKQPKQIIWTEGGHMFMTEENRASMIQWLREQDKQAR
jgi:pimeloyl-ACP methyl ester carboxylesterase